MYLLSNLTAYRRETRGVISENYRSRRQGVVQASAWTSPIAAEGGSVGRLGTWSACIAGAEILSVAAAAYLGSVLYHWLVLFYWPEPEKFVLAALLIAALVSLVSLSFGHFAAIQAQPRHRFLLNGVVAVTLAFSFFLSILFLLKIAESYSRGTFICQMLTVTIAVLATRSLCFSRLQGAIAAGLVEGRRAVVIGDMGRCSDLSERLMQTGIKVVRSVPFPDAGPRGDSAVGARRSLQQLTEECRLLRADDIVILSAEKEFSGASALVAALSELPVDVHLVPVASTLMTAARVTELGNVVTIRVSCRPLLGPDGITKRTFDIMLALAGLVLLFPLLLMVALAIKLDSRGPVLFRQTRHGYNNQPIRVFKFRSMYVLEDGDNFRQVAKNDPRVTPVGRFLRRANIDELPQLFNVLLGEMSIVGPRPHAIAHNETFEKVISPFSRRHNVKPGITGWAQVNGCRGETDTIDKMRRRVEYDLYYIDHWSLRFDLKIIIMTLLSKSGYLHAY